VYTGIGDELRYIETLLGAFKSRIERGREFALGHRVLLLRASNGIPLDLKGDTAALGRLEQLLGRLSTP